MTLTLTPDQINGLFELFGSLFILNHCRTLRKDMMVAGVSIISVVFFFAWGCWNIFYYPHLEQMWSFYGGLCIAAANTLYIGMLVYYKYDLVHLQWPRKNS